MATEKVRGEMAAVVLEDIAGRQQQARLILVAVAVGMEQIPELEQMAVPVS